MEFADALDIRRVEKEVEEASWSNEGDDHREPTTALLQAVRDHREVRCGGWLLKFLQLAEPGGFVLGSALYFDAAVF